MRKGIIILGTTPPPIGGVSIHTQRLIENLEKEKIDFQFINLRPQINGNFCFIKYIRNLIMIFLQARNSVIHYQLNNWLETMILLLGTLSKKNKIIFTVHSFTFQLKKEKKLKTIAIKFCRKNIYKFIAPSETIKKILIKNSFSPEKILILNTYLPPSKNELNMEIPPEIKAFVSKKEKIILANASNLYINEQGIDLYGIDMCIEACKVLPNTNFLLCIPKIKDFMYYEECKVKILSYGLEERILIYTDNISLSSLFKYCDLFVRPTYSDSYGISIAESLLLETPAIASDVCNRPAGTILFKSRDINDFIDKIDSCLKENKKVYLNIDNTIEEYINLYERTLINI